MSDPAKYLVRVQAAAGADVPAFWRSCLRRLDARYTDLEVTAEQLEVLRRCSGVRVVEAMDGQGNPLPDLAQPGAGAFRGTRDVSGDAFTGKR